MPAMSNAATHVTHDDLVLYYYGEAGREAARIDAHLAVCEECRASLTGLQHTLALVDTTTEGEPPAGFEATVWARLQPELDVPEPWWRRLIQQGPARWAMAGTVAAVVVGAFLAGWLARDVSTPPSAPAQAAVTAP